MARVMPRAKSTGSRHDRDKSRRHIMRDVLARQIFLRTAKILSGLRVSFQSDIIKSGFTPVDERTS